LTDPIIWYGELTTHSRLRARGIAVLAGAVLWVMVFLVAPSVVMAALAFARRTPYGGVAWHFTLENFRRLLGFGILEWSADCVRILARSVWIAFVTTVLVLLLAYPLAFYIAGQPSRRRYMWLALVIIPSCTNLVIRTYAWQLILGQQMLPARLAHALGLLSEGKPLYPGALAVYLGMVNSFLPLAVLPLYASAERLDWSLVEAAQDLYSSRLRTFMHGVLPQTLPGLTAAVILTFIPAMGAFVVPDLLGGAKYMLVGNLIQQQFGPSRDMPFGAAVSLALLMVTLAGLFVFRRPGQEMDLT
jgi:spermidine/putrescine transport system permease protein